MDLTFHPSAEVDLSEAEAYLEDQREGLGASFLLEVKRATDLIRKYPKLAPKTHPFVRRRTIGRFSYSLLYSIEESGIYILAVAHHRRKPDYWVHRLK